jgi:hypothetical protein
VSINAEKPLELLSTTTHVMSEVEHSTNREEIRVRRADEKELVSHSREAD